MEGLNWQLLLVHGTIDDNVHPQNTFQIIQKLKELGKLYYLLLNPNRTLSIFGGSASFHLHTMFTKFIKENL